MSIIKEELKSNYTKISNELIVSDLSDKAIRILLYLLSKPNDWNVNQKLIAKELKMNRNTITKTIKSLKDSGYLEISKTNKNYEYEYKIFTVPQKLGNEKLGNEKLGNEKLGNEKLGNEKLGNEKLGTQKTVQHNKTIVTKTINNKIINSNADEKPHPKTDEKIPIIENYFENNEVNVLFDEFLKNRISTSNNKKINTELSIKKLVNELNKHNDEIKKEMLNTSIANGYRGVFPPKKKNNQNNSNNVDADYLKNLLDKE